MRETERCRRPMAAETGAGGAVCFTTESQSNDIYWFHVCDEEAPGPGEVRARPGRHGNRFKRASLLVLPAWLRGMTYLRELADIQPTSPRRSNHPNRAALVGGRPGRTAGLVSTCTREMKDEACRHKTERCYLAAPAGRCRRRARICQRRAVIYYHRGARNKSAVSVLTRWPGTKRAFPLQNGRGSATRTLAGGRACKSV